MMNRFSVTIAFLLVPFVSKSQLVAAKPELNSTVMRASTYGMYDALNFPEDEPILGSPYLSDVYTKGNLKTKVGTFSNIDMRYNAYLDKVEFKEKDSVYALTADPIVHHVTIGDRKFIVDHVIVKGKTYNAFFIRLDTGALTLLMRPNVILKAKEEAKAIQTDPAPAKFIRKQDVFYIKTNSKTPIEISNIKSLISHLNDHKQEMEIFSKKNKISAKEEADLVKFVQHYNSL